VLDGFTQQLHAMKLTPASVTSYKRGASDFSAQVAKMKADGAIWCCSALCSARPSVRWASKKLGWDVTFLGAHATNVLEVPGLARKRGRAVMPLQTSRVPTKTPRRERVKRTGSSTTKKMFGADANTRRSSAYNAVMTSHILPTKAKDLTGQKMLDALESGDTSWISSVHRRPCFSKTNHLATNGTQVPTDQGRPLGLGEEGLMSDEGASEG